MTLLLEDYKIGFYILLIRELKMENLYMKSTENLI